MKDNIWWLRPRSHQLLSELFLLRRTTCNPRRNTKLGTRTRKPAPRITHDLPIPSLHRL